MEKSTIRTVAKLLTFIGSLNWGLIGIGYFTNSEMNIVHMAAGSMPVVEAVIYILVGICGLYLIIPGKR